MAGGAVTMLYRRPLLLNLALANAAMLPLLALAWIRLGSWEPLAWLGGLLAMDVRIVSRWVDVGVDVRWRDDGRSGGRQADLTKSH